MTDPNGYNPPELTLDPEDWQAMRRLGHQMVDDLMDYLQNVRERPVWQPIPENTREFLRQPLPREPQGMEQTYQDFVDYVLPYPMGNIHPRFWGWVMGSGTAMGALADMLAAGMNPNMGGGDSAPNYVEHQVVDWCKEMLVYPGESSGLLVSGGSMANLVGLAVARNAKAGYDVRQKGQPAAPKPMTLYASTETHSSVQKAVELMGLGATALRKVPTHPDFTIDVDALEQAIAADRTDGYLPFCVVGNAATVNTAAIDPLDRLADICDREGLWFHVDGAFGAFPALAPSLRPLVAGIERSDSVTLDFHKWMQVPFEAAAVLVKSEVDHRHTFALTPDYLAHTPRGVGGGPGWLSEYGVQLSRGFRALKVWMTIKEHGIDKFGRLVEQNVAQAHYLETLVGASPELECLSPVSLNIVCFRYIDPGLDETVLNSLNHEILYRLHESGIAVPSYTTLNGKFALRVAITNHRSRRSDFDLLVQSVINLGKQVSAEIAGVGEAER